MCGIFGVIAANESQYNASFLNKSLKTLAQLSESRGKDSSGICLFNKEKSTLEVVKGPVPVTRLFKEKVLKEKLHAAFHYNSTARYAFGHARLVTNGTQLNDENNQPVVKDGIIAIHNGIVVNVNELWEKHPEIKRNYEIDTEVFLSLIRYHIQQNKSLEESISASINEVFGTISTAMVFDDLNKFALATNNGSLYTIYNNKDIVFFASERYMLSEFVKKIDLSDIGNYELQQIKANQGMIIDIDNHAISSFSLQDKHPEGKEHISQQKLPIHIHSVMSEKEQLSTVIDLNYIHLNPQAEKEKALLQYPIDKIKTLKRCTKCLLPETFPYIQFDRNGICNYCNNYKPQPKTKSLEELRKIIEPYKKITGRPNCLLPYSGGRDSTYTLHIVKNELGLNPITFTYDWGMVTDLARRNIARSCGKLGVENIIVASNIHSKRRNIRKNVNAWLKNPNLGMIPLFMSGDKYFFYYANKVSKENNLDLTIWGSNYLENTDFKTGFCGIRPDFSKERIDKLNGKNKLKLIKFFSGNYISNPAYINISLVNTFGAFLSRYALKRRGYFQLFDYLEWNESEINNLIINEYDWELATDSKSTWRIGDGTASFYNYIYYTVAGFSEFDTFRSNQIREGMISREDALSKIYEENFPRYDTIKWYLEIIGVNFEDAIKTINKIPKLYDTKE